MARGSQRGHSVLTELFVIPVFEKYILYAPLHALIALVNRRIVLDLFAWQQEPQRQPATSIAPLLHQLQKCVSSPQPRSGPVESPLFLGLIPTRGCNMDCIYCDFAAPKHHSTAMSLSMAKTAVDAYLHLLTQTNHKHLEIHFFGGEPFHAAEVVHFVVNYATFCAAQREVHVHFEATSNGLYSARRCQWIADHFHTLILSLDGPPDIQNQYRPGLNRRPLAHVVNRTARILSASNIELILRSCVTAVTVERLPEIAHWFSTEFRPRTVCFESLTPSPLSRAAGLHPPNPLHFARKFDEAAQILRTQGIETILSTGDISTTRLTFCPVGQDALIVSPTGAVNACYLLPQDWQERGLDMRLGQVNQQNTTFELEPAAVRRARDLNVNNKPRCRNCFCRYHCAGGCHVNHDTTDSSGHYDDLCIQTRLITIRNLLHQLAQNDLSTAWLADDEALFIAALQLSDRLVDWEGQK